MKKYFILLVAIVLPTALMFQTTTFATERTVTVNVSVTPEVKKLIKNIQINKKGGWNKKVTLDKDGLGSVQFSPNSNPFQKVGGNYYIKYEEWNKDHQLYFTQAADKYIQVDPGKTLNICIKMKHSSLGRRRTATIFIQPRSNFHITKKVNGACS